LNSAISAYEAARALEPQNPYLDIAVGKLKLMEAQSSGDEAIDEKNKLIQEAKELFESAKEKTTFEDGEQEISIFAPAHYYIAITEEALNNIDEAIKSMMMALQITQMDRSLSQQQLLSRQVNYGFNLARLLQVRGSDEDNKNAENLLLQIIGVNDQEINSHLNLALLYEKTGRSDEALEEYKKILHMIPETDEKSRENIQGLIDTVEQGGSNVDASRTQDVNDGMDKAEDSLEENNEETVEDETQNISLLIISGNNSESDAEDGQKVLSSDGYEAEIRKEDRDISGVVIMYGGETDKGELKSIKEILERKFDKVESERNDEEVSTYNHDIVVVVGKTTEEASDEENTDENE
jgi:tetratricopeptide (TPR) repeat protein